MKPVAQIQHRLKGEKTFARLAKTGRRFNCEIVTFVYQSTQPDQPTRIGLVVSAKVLKLASQRNRLKRRLRAILFDALAKGYLNNTGLDIMVLAKSLPDQLSFTQLKEKILLCLRSFPSGPSLSIKKPSPLTTVG